MVFREQDKHFLWSLFAAAGAILAWRGVWEGLYVFFEDVAGLPYLADPWVFLFVGLAMLTFSGMIFKEFDPLGGVEKSVNRMMHYVHNHPKREEYLVKYHDKEQKKNFSFRADKIRHIEKNTLVVEHPQGAKELFIPLHRVTEILHKGKTYWRL